MKVTFPTLAFLVLMVLKLCKVITWSWWWVTSPLWIVIALVLIYVIVMVVNEYSIRKHIKALIKKQKSYE